MRSVEQETRPLTPIAAGPNRFRGLSVRVRLLGADGLERGCPGPDRERLEVALGVAEHSPVRVDGQGSALIGVVPSCRWIALAVVQQPSRTHVVLSPERQLVNAAVRVKRERD